MDWPPLRRCVVDLRALRANTAALSAHVGPRVALMAMVKGNGYGHGAVLTAGSALGAGARWLGVSCAEEAVQLRDAGLEAPLLVTGWSRPEALPGLLAAGVDVTAVDAASLDAVAAAARGVGRRARVHLKVDTGMHRQGAEPEQAEALLRASLAASGAIELAGVFTHLADADGADAGFTEEQHGRFLRVAELTRELAPGALLHCANSAATLRFPHMHHDLVRVGLALYGLRPLNAPATVALRPALTVLGCVVQVRDIAPGEAVGYGRGWVAPRPSRIAVIAAGYADGLQRAQGNRGVVLLRGQRCPIVGRVSMDQITADVTALPEVARGDEAVLLGGGPSYGGTLGAEAVAAAADTVGYEVLTGVSARVPRFVIDG